MEAICPSHASKKHGRDVMYNFNANGKRTYKYSNAFMFKLATEYMKDLCVDKNVKFQYDVKNNTTRGISVREFLLTQLNTVYVVRGNNGMKVCDYGTFITSTEHRMKFVFEEIKDSASSVVMITEVFRYEGKTSSDNKIIKADIVGNINACSECKKVLIIGSIRDDIFEPCESIDEELFASMVDYHKKDQKKH